MRTRNGSGADGSSGRTAAGERPRRGGLRGAIAGTAGLLLVIGASTIGLHDWADAHLDGVAAHGAASAVSTAHASTASTTDAV